MTRTSSRRPQRPAAPRRQVPPRPRGRRARRRAAVAEYRAAQQEWLAMGKRIKRKRRGHRFVETAAEEREHRRVNDRLNAARASRDLPWWARVFGV